MEDPLTLHYYNEQKGAESYAYIHTYVHIMVRTYIRTCSEGFYCCLYPILHSGLRVHVLVVVRPCSATEVAQHHR